MTPHEILARYHQAMIDVSADDLADLYAPDAVHEFPFPTPGLPDRYLGQQQVRDGYRAAWAQMPVRLAEIHNVAVHDTSEPGVIVSEWTGHGAVIADGRPFTLAGVLTIRVQDGAIAHVRDYIDALRVAQATGSLPATTGDGPN